MKKDKWDTTFSLHSCCGFRSCWHVDEWVVSDILRNVVPSEHQEPLKQQNRVISQKPWILKKDNF